MAATAPGYHVIVLLQHHVLIVVKVEQVDGVKLVWHTAGRVDALGELEGVDDGLDGGMVGGAHVLAQGEWAGALAVVGVVAAWRHDPAGPADLLKVHVERLALAGGDLTVLVIVQRTGTASACPKHGKHGEREGQRAFTV